jgi:hypothetical protein
MMENMGIREGDRMVGEKQCKVRKIKRIKKEMRKRMK